MGILGKLFGKEKLLDAVDIAKIRTDFHSHLIAGIDDGSDSLSTSVEMIRKFKDLGYEKLITTPHVMNDYYKNDKETILKGLSDLKDVCKEEGVDMELEAAAEYYLDEGFQNLIDGKQLLSFGDNYVLFELSFLAEPQNLNDIIFQLQTAGYKTILAHPERYMYWHKNFEKYSDLKTRSVYFQINMLSLTGAYSPEIKKIAERMIDEEMVEFIGSDCHNINQLNMIESNLGRKYLHKLLDSGKLKNHEL